MTRVLVMLAIMLAVTLGVVWLVGPVAGLDEGDAMQLVSLGLIGLMMASGVMASQRSASTALRNIALWLAIIFGLVSAYVLKDDAENLLARVASALNPGGASQVETVDGFVETVLYKSRSGHFEADVTVNGTVLDMLVDTGASGIALTWEDAERLGLSPETLSFSQTVATANGLARIAPVRLDAVSIGDIRRTGLAAGVAERGKLGQSLLGMNWLGTLSAVTISGDELRLRD